MNSSIERQLCTVTLDTKSADGQDKFAMQHARLQSRNRKDILFFTLPDVVVGGLILGFIAILSI